MPLGRGCLVRVGVRVRVRLRDRVRVRVRVRIRVRVRVRVGVRGGPPHLLPVAAEVARVELRARLGRYGEI